MAKSPDAIVAENDRLQNEEDLANLDKYVVAPAKAAYKKIKEGFLGTEAQNKYYEDKEAKAKAKPVAKAKGGTVKCKRDGIALRGKTKA